MDTTTGDITISKSSSQSSSSRATLHYTTQQCSDDCYDVDDEMFVVSTTTPVCTDSVSTSATSTTLSSPQSLCPIVSLWSEIVEYCTLSDSRSLFQTCRWLYIEVSPIVESNRQFLRLIAEKNHASTGGSITTGQQLPFDDLTWLQYQPLLTQWNYQLHTLDLSEYATDDILVFLQPHLPLLEQLHMVGSSGVTYDGIMTLSRSSHRQTNLRYLDVTFCIGVTYFVTLSLRRQMTHHPDLIIQRIPKWMEGHFYATPFPQDDGIRITYWADGSFRFQREGGRYHCGCVYGLFRMRGENGKEDDPRAAASQFRIIHEQRGEGGGGGGGSHWDTFVPALVVRPVTPWEYAFNQRLRMDNDDDDDNRTVLIGQCLKSEETPNFTLKREYDLFPIGIPQFFQNDGTHLVSLSSSCSLSSSLLLAQAINEGADVMVTRMLVVPLAAPRAMPPPDVVERIQSSMMMMT